jgi:hypothetical protein
MLQSAIDYGTMLWIGTYESGVVVVDISNPANVQPLTQNNVSFVVAGEFFLSYLLLPPAQSFLFFIQGRQQQPVMSLLESQQYIFAPTAAGLFVFSPKCTSPTLSTTGSISTLGSVSSTGPIATTASSATSTSSFSSISSTTGAPASSSTTGTSSTCVTPLVKVVGSDSTYYTGTLMDNGNK